MEPIRYGGENDDFTVISKGTKGRRTGEWASVVQYTCRVSKGCAI